MRLPNIVSKLARIRFCLDQQTVRIIELLYCRTLKRLPNAHSYGKGKMHTYSGKNAVGDKSKMASAKVIAKAIIDRVNDSKVQDYTVWRIGLTNDINQRYVDLRAPEYFLYWKADSISDAQSVESHFLKKLKMKGRIVKNLKSGIGVYVYIF